MSQQTKQPTTRVKKARELLAQRVLSVAHAYGAIAERFSRYDDEPREIRIRIDTGRLSVQFEINALYQPPDVVVLPWVSKEPMNRALDLRINPHHRMKLTAVVTSADQLVIHVTSMLALDKSGDLFSKVGENP